MQDYHGPHFTKAETCNKLGLDESELRFAVDEGKIVPLVHIPGRDLLAFSPQKEGWIGLGIVRYRGNMKFHKNYISALMDNQTITLGTGSGVILDPTGIEQVTTQNPFKDNPKPLVGWNENIATRENIFKQSMTFIPIQNQTLAASLAPVFKAAESLSISGDTKNLLRENANKSKNAPRTSLDFKTNSAITPDQLRFPKSEMVRFKRVTSAAGIAQPSNRKSSKVQRENQLNQMIMRIIADTPDISTAGIWDLMLRDFHNEEPLYDTDHIIVSMDSVGLA